MNDIRSILDEPSLRRLRDGWSSQTGVAQLRGPIDRIYPPFAPLNGAIESIFYSNSSPQRPIDRERCLIALLATGGAPVSLALHLYVGLMEGLEPEEICHITGLAAYFRGMPCLSESLPVLQRTFELLRRIAPETNQPEQIAPALLQEFGVAR